MRVSDILEHFLSRANWIDRAKTVDRVIAGDPDKNVDRCLVTWMPGFDVLRLMVERHIPLLVAHEPTFWDHLDGRPSDDPFLAEKEAFIRDHDLVVMRNHDCWDRWPGIGIPWAWARFLGLSGEPAGIGFAGYQHAYDITPTTVDAFAAGVARRCAAIGEQAVQVIGDGSRPIARVGIGTGCACHIPTFQKMGCDCSVVCDDGSCYWAGIQRARDEGHPVIRVNHGTSEEPGMVTLTRYINDNLPGLRAEHLPHGASFRLVSS